jgi:hypothetical protein
MPLPQSRRNPVRSALVASLAASLVAVCGCSASVGGDKIDHKKAEDVARKVAGSGTVHLDTVTCPSGVDTKKGADFDCDLVYADGTKGTITIHQTDDSGGIRTAGTDIHIQGK